MWFTPCIWLSIQSCSNLPKHLCFRTFSIVISFSSFSSDICQCLIVFHFSTCRWCRPKLLLIYGLEQIIWTTYTHCIRLHNAEPYSAYIAMESKAFRLFKVLSYQSNPVQYTPLGRISWALVMLLSHGEVKCHPDSRAVFPFNTSMECCLSLHCNIL